MTKSRFTAVETWESGRRYLEEQLKERGVSDSLELQLSTWDTLYSTLKEAIFQQHGAEVAEIGSTWLGSLVGMNALRPVTEVEVARMGGSQVFFPPLWETAFVTGDNHIWSIPWLGDARVIFYWRDMLASAGIDPQTAFQTPEQLEQTLAQLQAKGIPTPWSAPTNRNLNTLHHCASWVWQAGGDFLRKDGSAVLFTQPEAIRGIQAYFRLHRYMPETANLPPGEVWFSLFMNRQVAVSMSGPWEWDSLETGNMEAEMLALVGTALPPGPSFVGSSNLVIMSHVPSRDERAAVDWITHLVSPRPQVEYNKITGLLPVRMDVLSEPHYSADPKLQTFIEALKTGRAISNARLWGIIEERLTEAFARIWHDLNAQPEAKLETIIVDHLEPLAKRMNRMLAQ